MHPLTVVSVILLIVNDWILKRHVPGAITGKLSDIAGLVFAPLVLASAIGLALHLAARLGARVDPSLSRRRLLTCIAATGIVFTAVKLSPDAARVLADLLPRGSRIVVDATDLLTLPALAIAYFIGRDELRRVPLGRPAAIHRLGRPAASSLRDTGASPALVRAIEAWQPSEIDRLLAQSGAL
jgi:hypothetical protein